MKFNAKTTCRNLVLVLFLCLTQHTFAQEKKPVFWQNVRFGGAIGLGFGDGFFSGTIAPSAIYQFNQYFSAGIGLNATYSSLKNEYNSTILGGSAIGLFNILPEIQISTEFEQLHVSQSFEREFITLNGERFDTNYWYPALFLGVGYGNTNFTVGVRYDILYDNDRSIAGSAFSPFVRVFF